MEGFEKAWQEWLRFETQRPQTAQNCEIARWFYNAGAAAMMRVAAEANLPSFEEVTKQG